MLNVASASSASTSVTYQQHVQDYKRNTYHADLHSLLTGSEAYYFDKIFVRTVDSKPQYVVALTALNSKHINSINISQAIKDKRIVEIKFESGWIKEIKVHSEVYKEISKYSTDDNDDHIVIATRTSDNYIIPFNTKKIDVLDFIQNKGTVQNSLKKDNTLLPVPVEKGSKALPSLELCQNKQQDEYIEALKGDLKLGAFIQQN